jgi:hypothetical protein
LQDKLASYNSKISVSKKKLKLKFPTKNIECDPCYFIMNEKLRYSDWHQELAKSPIYLTDIILNLIFQTLREQSSRIGLFTYYVLSD